ncbi:MAG: hypothetical protein AAFX05_14630, partial [Planctomycetota bacterium]
MAGILMFLLVVAALITSGTITPRGGGSTQFGLTQTGLMLVAICLFEMITVVPLAFVMRSRVFTSGRDPETGVLSGPAILNGTLLSHALFESFGLFGVVICLIEGTLWPGAVFPVISLVLMGATFPRASLAQPRGPSGGDATIYNTR